MKSNSSEVRTEKKIKMNIVLANKALETEVTGKVIHTDESKQENVRFIQITPVI